MRQIFNPLFSLALLLALAGCQSGLRSDVVTFHQQPIPMGESIRIQAMDPDKAGSLEFRRYAELVSRQLRIIGYEPVPLDAEVETDLVAEIDYEVRQGPTEVHVNEASPFVRYHFSYGRFYDPFYFGIYDTWSPDFRDVYTVNSFVRRMELNILEEDGRERIFEGRVESVGNRSELPDVMPYMITAMFTNFPGESGVTKVVTVERDGLPEGFSGVETQN